MMTNDLLKDNVNWVICSLMERIFLCEVNFLTLLSYEKGD